MSGHPWYKRYGADFVHGCLGLSLEEKGAYSLCLDLIYDHGGPIPDDGRWLSGVCGVSLRKWSALRGRLIEAGKLVAADGRLTNRRAEREIENAAKAARKHAENGAQGGRKRADNEVERCKGKTLGEASLRHRERNQKPEPRSQSSDADASGATPAPAEPVYADARHALYGEGKPILLSLGVAEKQCGAMITRWLRDTADDCGGVLDAIRRARDKRVLDPISWITRALPTRTRNDRPDRPHADRRSPVPSTFNTALADAVARRAGRGHPPDDPGSAGFD
ncbi:YdaU family protein [Xanthobacter sp. V4C-4]|uniref:YdaU family protein n=1 Tax=Xanthobacter cornucopiae TaxID=3119924 RepID=UPI003729EE41